MNSKKQNEVKFLDHIKTIIDTKSTNAESIMQNIEKIKIFLILMKNKIVAIQGDNLKKLSYNNDTTIFLAFEAQKQGSKIFYYEPKIYSLKIIKYMQMEIIKFYNQKKFFKLLSKKTIR